MQNEKKIREQEYTIQTIVFTRMYERRMNIKVWNYFSHNWNIDILFKNTNLVYTKTMKVII